MSALERVKKAYQAIALENRPEVWISLRSQHEVESDAAAVDALVAAGKHLPLAGLVFAIKDNIDLAGVPTTAAHPGFHRVPEKSAEAVQLLIEAGAVPLGKTNLDQFATGLVGTRSPYGAVRNSIYPDRISGGSSSGSAVAVALDFVDFALGTDTAGSGRVPAALNNLVGIKTTLGLVSVSGVLPACRSYDCVTVFAKTLELTTQVTRLMIGSNSSASGSRSWPVNVKLAAPRNPRVAIPAAKYLGALNNDRLALFKKVVFDLRGKGVTVEEIEFSDFLDCAKLLYDGALVAERYAAFGDFIESHPEGADPSVYTIAARAKKWSGYELVNAQENLGAYRAKTSALIGDFDALLIPTTPKHPRLVELALDPIGLNSQMGIFTNFMNLLDMAGVAVPAGETEDGLFGVTFAVRAFEDQVAIDLAAKYLEVESPLLVDTGLDVAVFGAHMEGLPLSGELESLGARRVGEVNTAPDYRLTVLDTVPPKPGLVRVESGTGAQIAGERWTLSSAALGTFLAGLPQPMTLGPVTLSDLSQVTGFGCSFSNGPDISHLGGWRKYLEAGSN